MNSYHVKYKCLQELEEGTLKPREAAKKYKVNNRTISRWKADAESIRQRVEEAPPGAKLTRKPRTDFKRKERPLTKEERLFKTFVESRGKITKLRMADVIAKCQKILPSSQEKQGHNLYMYVFRWLRRHQLMDYVAFNSTGRPKVHTSDEEGGDFDDEYGDMDEFADDDDDADGKTGDATDVRARRQAMRVAAAAAADGEQNSRADEMNVIYALTTLAEGCDVVAGTGQTTSPPPPAPPAPAAENDSNV
ncbi:Aste57867_25421 [Aphanomyces stellatus]|uniref:Aste57867_25421 protein n=1 Tax=Aphanomyces stellatus TaxID=120398 RepID=A0A485LTR3_9STRA|nr:hypothetical protein As57867_025342 [Aphanomyces stellatus]VFU02045.1 Aste57867_25421 [Aphanomyces stellatus]